MVGELAAIPPSGDATLGLLIRYVKGPAECP